MTYIDNKSQHSTQYSSDPIKHNPRLCPCGKGVDFRNIVNLCIHISGSLLEHVPSLQFPSESSSASWQSSYKCALVFLMHVILVVCQDIPLRDEAKQKAT